MEAEEIRRFILKDPQTRSYFAGVIAKDEIPKEPQKNKTHFYVVNTQTADLPGQHWVVLWYSGVSNYFDPEGHPPFLQAETSFLHRRWTWNALRIQPFYSIYCGLYCLYFVYFKSRGFSMKDIVSSFSPLLRLNDRKVRMFCRRYK